VIGAGREVMYHGAVLTDREFVSERSSEGYREFQGPWLDAVGAALLPANLLPRRGPDDDLVE
jgi:hypothetical protein